MKKVGEIMAEMGFKVGASEATQRAFIKYLIRVASKSRPKEPTIIVEAEVDEPWRELNLYRKKPATISDDTTETKDTGQKHKQEQLCFSFFEKKSDSKAS